MTLQTTVQLLRKYEKPYVPGEKRSKNYDKNMKKESKLKNRMLILYSLLNELPPRLRVHKDQVILCQNLIRTFNDNFKYLHRQASEETIILAFIFYQKKLENPRLIVEKYSICKKNGLTTPIFLNICCRIANYYMMNSPINIRQTTDYDHSILVKNGTL